MLMAVEYAEDDFYNKFSTDITYDTENRPTYVYYGFDYADPTGGNDATFIYDYSNNDDSTLNKLLIKQNSSTVVTITPIYDALSRVTTQTNKVGSATNTINYQFKANGSSTSAQVSQMTSKVGSTTTTYKYTYDENGNITEIANASGVIQNKYWYDDLGQLRREDNRATGRTYLFNYDNAGNIQYRKTYAFTTAGTATSVSTTLYSTDNYTYGNANWGDLLTAYKGTTISYDTIGNPLNYYNGYTFTWAKGRQLASATNGTNNLSFTYNADGIRTSKTVNGVKHTYLLSGSTIMAEYWQQSGVQHVLIYLYDNAGAPVGMMYRTNAYAADTYDYFLFEKNLQGDIVAVYNASGTKLLSYTYDAWGNCTVTGSTTTGAQYNPFRYRGYYYDSELGLYYLNARYYDPSIGRFINADVYVSTGQGLLGYNVFAYCRNEPVFRKDAYGTEDVSVTNFDDDNNPLNDLGKSPSGGSSGGAGKGINSPAKGSRVNISNTSLNHSRPTVIKTPETKLPTQMKTTDAVDAWDKYLGNKQTNYNPYKGVTDPDRIFSADGTRSIRFGNHEIDEFGTSKAHFHFERWEYNAFSNTVTWYNAIQRLK